MLRPRPPPSRDRSTSQRTAPAVGHGHGHGHDDDGGGEDNGPRHWDPVDACVGVQGPFGYVQGSACI